MKKILLYIFLLISNVVSAQYGRGIIMTDFQTVRTPSAPVSPPIWFQNDYGYQPSSSTVYTCEFKGDTYRFHSSRKRDEFCELGNLVLKLEKCISKIQNLSSDVSSIQSEINNMYYYLLHRANYQGSWTGSKIRSLKRKIDDIYCNCNYLSNASDYARRSANYADIVRSDNLDFREVSNQIDDCDSEFDNCIDSLNSAIDDMSYDIKTIISAMKDLL